MISEEEKRLIVILASIENARQRIIQAQRADWRPGIALEEIEKIINAKNAFDRAVRS